MLITTLGILIGLGLVEAQSFRLASACTSSVMVTATGSGTALGGDSQGGLSTATSRALASAVASVHGAYVSLEEALDVLDVMTQTSEGTSLETETRVEESMLTRAAGVVVAYQEVARERSDVGIEEVTLDVEVCLDARVGLLELAAEPDAMDGWVVAELESLFERAGITVVPLDTSLESRWGDPTVRSSTFLETGVSHILVPRVTSSVRRSSSTMWNVETSVSARLLEVTSGDAATTVIVRGAAPGLTEQLARGAASREVSADLFRAISPYLITFDQVVSVQVELVDVQLPATLRSVDASLRDVVGVVRVVQDGQRPRWTVEGTGIDACGVADALVGMRRFLGYVEACDATSATIRVTRE